MAVIPDMRLGCTARVVTVHPPLPPVARVRPPALGERVAVPVYGPEGRVGPPGPEGPPGVPGTGPTWWFGHGPPDVIPGSKPGDRYLDEDTGIIWELGD